MEGFRRWNTADFVRQLLLGWLAAVTMEYLRLPKALRVLSGLDGLRQMSFPRVLVLTFVLTAALWLLSRFVKSQKGERIAIPAVLAVLTAAALTAAYTGAFLLLCMLFLGIAVVYALWGWDGSEEMTAKPARANPVYIGITAGLSLVFFLFVSAWTVSRVESFCAPTFDFGIFSQMFYNMKETGLPMTTVERDGLLSHFAVHMSPIYYLMLPFYCLAPTPATLQVLQAAVMTSAVLPL